MQTKSPEKICVSLDIGHSSIGWSVVEPKSLKIKGCGSLLFQADDCLASKRRLFRSGRRNIAARRNRIARIAALLRYLGIFSDHSEELVVNSQPWLDAARSLNGLETLDWPKLWNVIRWYAHNRGYDGNKAWKKGLSEEEEEEETKRVQAANGLMKEYSTSTMAETICAMLELDFTKGKRSTTGKKYKTGDHAFDRSIVEAEVRAILEAHKGKLKCLDDKLIKALLEDAKVMPCPDYDLPLRFQRGLLFGGFVPRFDNRLISICPITGEKTPSKRRKEFFEYRWAMVLAGLRIFGDQGESNPLSAEERKLLDDEIRRVGFFTKSSLKKFLKEHLQHQESNIGTYFLTKEMEQALVFDPAKRAIDLACLTDAFSSLPKQVQRKMHSRLNKLKRICPLDWLEISEGEDRTRQLIKDAFDKVMKRKRGNKKPSFEAWAGLSIDVDKHIPSGRAPYAKRILIEATKQVMQGKEPRAEGGCLANVSEISKEKLSTPIDKQTNNHLVRHRLLMTERVYKEIVEQFANGDLSVVDSVVIETARDIREFSGKTNKEKQKIIGGKLKQHRDAVKRLEKKRTESGINFKISAGLIRKTRIAMDMDWRCPFTGDHYDELDIVNDRIDVEHIIPRSVRPSDSLEGLVLTFKEVNKWKNNRTALEFIIEEGGNAVPGLPQKQIMSVKPFEAFVKKLKINRSSDDDSRRCENRKRFLTLLNYNPKESDFTSGDLTVTSQINRLAAFRVKAVHKEEPKSPKIISLPGSVTGLARRNWKLLGCLSKANPRVLNEDGTTKTKSEIREITHLHHALDATAAAIVSLRIPNDGEVWRLLNKRRLNNAEANFIRPLDAISISANNEPLLKDLSAEIKNDLAVRLSEKRVRVHIPSKIGTFAPDENQYGIESVDDEKQVVKLRRGGKTYGREFKFSLLSGLKPTKTSKLENRKAILLAEGNYGLWLDDIPQVIPNLRSWEKIKELRTSSPEALILRREDLINVKSGDYQGTWRVKSIKDSKGGITLSIVPVDSVSLDDGIKAALVKTLRKGGLEIIERSLI